MDSFEKYPVPLLGWSPCWVLYTQPWTRHCFWPQRAHRWWGRQLKNRWSQDSGLRAEVSLLWVGAGLPGRVAIQAETSGIKNQILGLPWGHSEWRTQVWPLVQEDSTCHRTTKPMHHHYWGRVPRICAQQQEKPLQREADASQPRVAPATRESHRDPVWPKQANKKSTITCF